MQEPVKVAFFKLLNGNTYTSTGYYTSQKDFEDRNPTLIFKRLTKTTKPIPKEKEEK